MAGFSGGWHSNFPPAHFYLLAWLFAPVLGAMTQGLLEPAVPGTPTYLALFVIERMASVVMAALTVVLVHLSGQQLYGPRAAAFAAFTFAFTLPFGFYAKLANLDVPYLFWFAVSFWFYVRIVQSRRTADHYWYAAAATLAVGTKDQAYGLYLLPSLHIALLAWRSSKDAPRPGVVLPESLWDRRSPPPDSSRWFTTSRSTSLDSPRTSGFCPAPRSTGCSGRMSSASCDCSWMSFPSSVGPWGGQDSLWWLSACGSSGTADRPAVISGSSCPRCPTT